jgi:general secretion pathway protein F
MQIECKVLINGTTVKKMSVDASTIGEARRQVEQLGYLVLSARQSRPSVVKEKYHAVSVPLFSQELLVLLQAGLSLVESIEILARKTRESGTKSLLEKISRDLHEGASFSAALEKLPQTFSSLYVAAIKSSEQTGDLVEALQRFLDYHRQMQAVREKVAAATVYPALLLGVGLLVVMFLLGYVVPRFSLVYGDVGRDLPLMSRVLMGWGQFVGRSGWMLGAGAIAAIVLAAFALTRSATRSWFMRLLWSIPALGERVRLYQLARFTRTLAMLIEGGIPFVSALKVVGDLLELPALRTGLNNAAKLVSEGRTISEAFAIHGLATEVGVRLITVGERSGELGKSLERIANLYDEELSRWVAWFTKLFEPVLMIGIGLVIGVIVVLMYLPIFELANGIQ